MRVSGCELRQHPESYHGSLVVVEARVLLDPFARSVGFVDPLCRGLVVGLADTAECVDGHAELQAVLDEAFEAGDREYAVSVTGWFEYRPSEVPITRIVPVRFSTPHRAPTPEPNPVDLTRNPLPAG